MAAGECVLRTPSSIASISKLPPALTCTFWEAFRYFWNYCNTFCAILGLKFNTVRFAFKCTSLKPKLNTANHKISKQAVNRFFGDFPF